MSTMILHENNKPNQESDERIQIQASSTVIREIFSSADTHEKIKARSSSHISSSQPTHIDRSSESQKKIKTDKIRPQQTQMVVAPSAAVAAHATSSIDRYAALEISSDEGIATTHKIKPPKRPLSSYNFYFREKRAELVGLSLSEYDPSYKTKRVHEKTHGKISFQSMVKNISEQWNTLSAEDRARYQELATIDNKRYYDELDKYKKEITMLRKMAATAKRKEVEQKKRKGKKKQEQLLPPQQQKSAVNASVRQDETDAQVAPSSLNSSLTDTASSVVGSHYDATVYEQLLLSNRNLHQQQQQLFLFQQQQQHKELQRQQILHNHQQELRRHLQQQYFPATSGSALHQSFLVPSSHQPTNLFHPDINRNTLPIDPTGINAWNTVTNNNSRYSNQVPVSPFTSNVTALAAAGTSNLASLVVDSGGVGFPFNSPNLYSGAASSTMPYLQLHTNPAYNPSSTLPVSSLLHTNRTNQTFPLYTSSSSLSTSSPSIQSSSLFAQNNNPFLSQSSYDPNSVSRTEDAIKEWLSKRGWR